MTDVPKAHTALVLGASVSSSGALSPVLQERAATAVALYRAGKVQRILVTGDNSTLQYNEVYPVGKYLLAQGVPQRDIFLDYAGFDTYSSMYRARYVFGVTSMIVPTQHFHLPRALFVARTLGIEAYGVDVARPHETYTLNALRELPATAKAVVDVLRGRLPIYMGSKVSVFGDGTTTWVGGALPPRLILSR